MSESYSLESDELNFDLGLEDTRSHVARTRQYTVGDLLRKNARVRADETAVVGEDDERLTYGELDERVNSLANALLERGYDHGSTIALVTENRPEFIEVLFAGAKIGALVPTQNWRLGAAELRHCLELTDPDAVVISGKHEEKTEWIEQSDDMDPEIIGLGDADVGADYESLVASGRASEPEPSRAPDPEDGAVVLYTSGTTGLPKGAVVSHRAMIHRGILWSRMMNMKDAPDFVGWNPMFHMAGAEPLMGVAINGGTFYTIDSFQLELILHRQREANANFLTIFPSTVKPFFEYAESHEWDSEEYGVEIIGAMADLYAPERIKAITELFDCTFLNSFGTTETGLAPGTGGVLPTGIEPTKEDLGKIEAPLCEVKLVDENWNEVPTGETGEAAVRGPTLLSGYINNAEVNETEFEEGWFRLGDMFRRDEDGALHYVDRRKYLIKSGGENIYPAEIERFLLDHPDVTEACVIRVPDETWGEVPLAYISTVEGSDLTADDVNDFLGDRIAGYKLPHYVDFVDEDAFPRSTSGKIQRQELEDWEITADRVRNPAED